MAIRKLRRVVKNQQRKTAAGGEPLTRGCKVASQDIGLADPIVAKEAIGSLGIPPVLTCSWGRGSYSARHLFQQLPHPLAVADIQKLASRDFIVYPFIRPKIRWRIPAVHALNLPSIPHGNHCATFEAIGVSTQFEAEYNASISNQSQFRIVGN
jgi:hypothetical protein